MADSHSPGGHGDHHGPDLRTYLIVAAALGGFTLVSFVCNYLVRAGSLNATTSFLIILAVACAKATLVTLIFMHVKWDWKLLYFMLIPAFVLAVMMMLVLLPDGLFAWKNDTFDPQAAAVTTKH